MGNKIYPFIGTVFMIASGLIYTTERIFEKIADAIQAAGFASNGIPVQRAYHYHGFFDNFFVWFFFFLGILMLSYGFMKSVLTNIRA